MKKMYTFKSWWIVGILLCVMGAFSSCLKSGDETIALESGEADVLILGGWKVERASIYDAVDHTYISDLPEQMLLGTLFELKENGTGVMIQDQSERTISWNLSSDGIPFVLFLGHNTYDLISLGEKVMVLETPYTVDGESVILRYVLIKHTAADTEGTEQENATQIISSSESAILNKGGFKLSVPKGAIPENDKGGDGKVAFSAQEFDQLPAPLPDGLSAIEGTGMKFEPMNFTFRTPLTLEVPLKGYNADEVGLYRYNEATGLWELLPFSSVDDELASVSVIDLGYFILAKKESSVHTGGLFIDKKFFDAGYYYYVTLIPLDGSMDGIRRIGFAADGSDLYMSNIPFGEYKVELAREQKNNWQDASSATQYISNDIIIAINTPLRGGNGGFGSYTGWTELTTEDIAGHEFYWVNGRPDYAWGEETKTYGTGKFQATLTWVNVSESITDYDLHLTVPGSSKDVYFGNKNVGAFELDRDWISTLGNATENIYSINDEFTPGTYKVRVHHYSGVIGKRYNCRILIDGVVVKSVSGAITTNKQYDDIYSFTIE